MQLPGSLYIKNRFSQIGEYEFRLESRFREELLLAGQATPPAPLPPASAHPMLDFPLLVQHLNALLRNYLHLEGAAGLTIGLAHSLIERVCKNRDGYLAAALLRVEQSAYTARHALFCAILAIRMGEALEFPTGDIRHLVAASLTMNVGSVGLHDEMNHRRGTPTTMQWQQIKIHPLTSAAILREAGVVDERWHNGVLLHHEKRNGLGYPFGLRDDEIPMHAHLLHVLDIVCARLMPRGYRNRVPAPTALAALYTSKNEPIDITLAAHLIRVLGLYPPGSFVELKNGEVALVVHVGANAAAPHVSLACSDPLQLVDTASGEYRIARAVNFPVDDKTVALYEKCW
ncbi:HD-GYP domain-containing protein [Paludibacterium yongneupense]|uniref:HD-GYP domain-containing protein n=1 Tax=Paludibacterium yongneupense TaxID=400061 RepID=UPI00041775C5|nr:HD domain-containing phosphohydrolase [Paludibacterium yongneupense]